ncbi:MAG: MBL fold metallo-hydrolase [Candidatus Lambdaproteobacteria bacterium]|nr:MBL fold metallo-hydrolase [Candidatus Lambdaproteobacteria bacterium]
MDKIEQALYRAEYAKFVAGDGGAVARLEEELPELFRKFWLRVDIPSVRRRTRSLAELPPAPPVDAHYMTTFGVRGVVRYPLTSGETVYKIPVFSFAMNDWKDHWTTTYLVVGRKGSLTLIDAGSHLSEDSLREGLAVVSGYYGERLSMADIDNVVITHAHFDHFGGLRYLMAQAQPRLWVHQWDAHTVAEFPREVLKGREQILRFLQQSGMPDKEIAGFMELHGAYKQDFPGYAVTDPFEDGQRIIEEFEVVHTPGHCPGLSCLRVGDVMMLGDHVLNDVSPHQFPKIYTSGSGLLNYFNSLVKICARSEKVRLGLPSHYGDIPDVEARAMQIMAEHNQRIADIIKDLDRPKTLYEVSNDYYEYRRGREIRGYDSLLALEEIGAHLEYMIETLGIVRVDNHAAAARDGAEVVRYVAAL